MDDYEKYLKHVSQVKRKTFSRGFIEVSGDTSAAPTGNADETIVRMEVGTALSGSNMLPLKKKRARSTSSDDEAIKVTTVTARADKHEKPSAPVPAAVTAAPPRAPAVQGKKTVSLLQKWFPGNALKEATVEASQAPSADYVEITITRFATARERMISLRSDVEDVERILADHAGGEGALKDKERRRALVTETNWKDLREALAQCAERAPTTYKETKRMVGELLRRKDRVRVPLVCSVKRWHEFLNRYGPMADKYPSLSQLVWLSSAGTTCGFSVLVKRFTHGVKDAMLAAQGTAATCASDSRGKLYIADEEQNEDDEEKDANPVEEDAEHHTNGAQNNADDPIDMLIETQPELTHVENEAQRKLLVFLRFFMPSESAPAHDKGPRRFSGFGVWLLAMLTALDAPLDPDTDRLVHDLFRRTCEQVRVLGDYKNIHGEHRGDLVRALASCDTGAAYKSYTRMEDVGKTDVLALYSLLIVLSNFFRQNQNRLIPL